MPPTAPLLGVENRDFTIGAGVTRAVHELPYERQPGDPLYRPLRIFSLDPSVSRLEGAEALVLVPYEPLRPGPVGRIFEVDDFDATQNTHWGRVDLDDHALLLNDGRVPSISDPLFHQQMVYAVCSTVHAAFRRALGRHVTWGFKARAGSASGRLRIRPHAFLERNAFYDHESGELRFGYFRAAEKVGSRTLPGGVVFTCLSHDIVAHEVTHALLDGLRAHFTEPTGADVLGFHEGFADLVAIFQHFSYRDVLAAAIRRSQGKLAGVSLLTGIAHEFGSAAGSTKPLRTAFEVSPESPPKQYRDDMEAHEMGEILVQAVFEALLCVFGRKVAQYIRLASGGTGRLIEGELPVDLQNIFAEQASKLASHFLAICIRAIDYCPPVDLELGEYLRALITADYDLVPDDRWAYREALIDAFRLRGIYPPNVTGLSEESLRWQTSELSVKTIPNLSFAALKFNGDPATPADTDALQTQARALGSVLGCPHNLSQFGLVHAGDSSLDGDQVQLPRVQSIRSSRRVGPDGQIVFDLVAEVTQRRIVQDPRGDFDFFGGATVIIGPKGEIRYVIAKNILNCDRLERQREFVHGIGGRYWCIDARGVMKPVENAFRLLHEPKDVPETKIFRGTATSFEVKVCSRERWNHTGIQLESGASYHIKVPSGQHWNDMHLRYGPEGGTTGWAQEKFAHKLRFKGDARAKAEYFTLIGTIGESLDHAFVIGSGPVDFVAPISGELVCFANDVPQAYWNNSGHVTFTITISSV
ncbi:MAG TPA: hypothetical protein VIT91_03680 [Chthoniobacterales bacterium]